MGASGAEPDVGLCGFAAGLSPPFPKPVAHNCDRMPNPQQQLIRAEHQQQGQAEDHNTECFMDPARRQINIVASVSHSNGHNSQSIGEPGPEQGTAHQQDRMQHRSANPDHKQSRARCQSIQRMNTAAGFLNQHLTFGEFQNVSLHQMPDAHSIQRHVGESGCPSPEATESNVSPVETAAG